MNRRPARPLAPLWLLLALLVASVLAACGGGGTASPPSITAQPADTSVVSGTTATFTVSATGDGSLAYQWQSSSDGVSWAPIAGATANRFTTPVTSTADNGRRYRVVVSGSGFDVASSAVRLTVTGAAVAPAITVQPASQSVEAPSAASFSVTATGTALQYQWQRSTDGGATWADVTGATASTHTTAATTVAMNNERYRVVITNAGGSATSAAAVLSVTPTPVLPTFTAHPSSQSVNAGDAAAFTVTAIGTPTPALQWQRSTDGGTTWAPIAAATDATYNTGATTAAQDGERYRAIASNSAGSATSDSALLSVSSPTAPAITSQPANATIIAGQGASFIVGVSGTPTPALQWQLSTDQGATWGNINGATSDLLSLPAGVPLSHDGRQYRAVATNASGTATSNAAVLRVNPSTVGSFQFNLFGYNAGPAVFLLYGGHVRDDGGTIQCSGYAAQDDPCPKWRGFYPSGTALTLTATAWPGWRVSRWVGGDCGSPGTASSVTLIIDHHSNCMPQFERIPGAAFSLSAVAAGPWVGWVVEMVADRYGYLYIADPARISCGPMANAQVCAAQIEVGDSPYTLIRLRAMPLNAAPAGDLRWTCTWNSPDDNSAVVRTWGGADIDIGPIYGNTSCSVELVPAL